MVKISHEQCACVCFAVTCDGGCWNGGECTAVNGVAKCICPSSWAGSKCQEGSWLYLITQLTQEVKGAKWSCSSAADISGCLRLFMAPRSCHQGKQQSV